MDSRACRNPTYPNGDHLMENLKWKVNQRICGYGPLVWWNLLISEWWSLSSTYQQLLSALESCYLVSVHLLRHQLLVNFGKYLQVILNNGTCPAHHIYTSHTSKSYLRHIATLGSILDFHLGWKSGNFPLTRCSHLTIQIGNSKIQNGRHRSKNGHNFSGLQNFNIAHICPSKWL